MNNIPVLKICKLGPAKGTPMDHADLAEQLEAVGQTTVRRATLARRARARLTTIKLFCTLAKIPIDHAL